MRARNAVLLVLLSLLISSIPNASDALTVTFTDASALPVSATCTPVQIPGNCTVTPLVVGETTVGYNITLDLSGGTPLTGTPATNDGFSAATCSGCVGPARVVQEQSGVVIKATLTDTVIAGPANETLAIVIASDFDDVVGVPTCEGCQAATSWSGFFSGVTRGDSIAATSTATGNIINPTPPPQGEQGPSLPSQCSGQTGCAFTVSNVHSFADQITEPVNCFSDGPLCFPSISTALNVTLVNTGDSVHFPLKVAQALGGTLPATDLLQGLTIKNCKVDASGGHFDLTACLVTLKTGTFASRINLATEYVTMALGNVVTLFPANSFQLTGTEQYAFQGTLPNGIYIEAVIQVVSATSFIFKAQASAGPGTANPLPLTLTITDAFDQRPTYSGSTAVSF